MKSACINWGVINSTTHFNINGAAKPLAFPRVSIIAANYIFL